MMRPSWASYLFGCAEFGVAFRFPGLYDGVQMAGAIFFALARRRGSSVAFVVVRPPPSALQ